METLTIDKIYSLSNAQIAMLLKTSFFKLGKKMDLSKEEIDVFIADIRKYQGRISAADFEEAFALYANGELNPERLPITVSPMFVGRLMKAYKALRQPSANGYQPSANGHQPSAISHQQCWNNYFKHITTYGSLPASPNWIALFNHCVYKNWITDVHPIEEWNYKASQLAERDVRRFTDANWGELITDNNVYNSAKGSKYQGLGTRMKKSYEL